MPSAQAKVTLIVLVAAVGLGVLIKLPESWCYTDFASTPLPAGKASAPKDRDGIKREMVKFQCTTNSSESLMSMWMCDGWLYTPLKELSLQNKDKQFPVIVMAHGIGATKDQGLAIFAEQFAENGFMVLLFDYLHFGLSDGTPRHKINPMQHVMDYQSAIRYVESNEDVDATRIGLWGTSYAGGHVLVTASKEKSKVKAVISQMPFLGALPSENPMDEMKKRGIPNVIKGLLGAVSSKVRQQFGMSALYSRMYGHVADGEKLALNYWETFGGSQEKWLSKHPKTRPNDWRNAVATESLLDMVKYKPVNHIDEIDSKHTKVLVVQAKHDKLCPNHRMDYVIQRLQCESHMEDTTHFGMYTGKIFDSVIKVQVDFFNRHLKPSKTLKVLD